MPAFDLTRIERTGEAVIAGRAAPGAVVDLLRNGERLDEAVANSSGQFVIVPPRLPPGSYELALTSRSPDGTLATSKKGVAVAIDEITARPGTPRSGTESIADTARAKEPERAGMSSQAQLLSQPASHVLKRQVGAAARVSRARPAMADGGSCPPASKTFTKIVSRGDSLWRISRLTYGDGSRYAVVYSANRDRIRDPNVILPGQILILPTKAR